MISIICTYSIVTCNHEAESIFIDSVTGIEASDFDDFEIIFDGMQTEEMYPLVDFDTICTDYEIQDYIDGITPQIDKNNFEEVDIPALPQAPESIILTLDQEDEHVAFIAPESCMILPSHDLAADNSSCKVKSKKSKKKREKKERLKQSQAFAQ